MAVFRFGVSRVTPLVSARELVYQTKPDRNEAHGSGPEIPMAVDLKSSIGYWAT